MPSHAHGVLGISVVLRGSVEETAGRSVFHAGVASAVIKPAGTVHANRFGPEGARLLSVELEPTRIAGLLDDRGSLDQWRWFRVTRALGVATRALLDLSECAPPPDDAIESLAVELVAALDGDAEDVRGSPPPWLRAVRERLEDDFERQCLVRDLAREAGVHPVHLARRFRRHYGLSVLDYLRGVRIRAVVRALADAETPLSEIALSTGFSDQSHLTRVLRATTGITPRRYRHLARSA
jgi:AraC family transcriptional regulator